MVKAKFYRHYAELPWQEFDTLDEAMRNAHSQCEYNTAFCEQIIDEAGKVYDREAIEKYWDDHGIWGDDL